MRHLIADFDAGQKSASRRSPIDLPEAPFGAFSLLQGCTPECTPSLNIPAAYSQCSSAARPSQTCHTGSERSASPDPANRTCGPRSAATTKHYPACTADVPPAAVRAQTHLTPLL